ncbi:MAG: VTT domain-containing protein [Cyanobacteria bacterium J06621_11]
MHLDFFHVFSPDVLSVTIAHAGLWGPLLYMVVIALSVVISTIPGAPLAVVAGTLWSPLLAGAYTVLGGFSGALIAYAIGRTVGQPAVKRLTGKTLIFAEVEGEKTLGAMVFITRLLPVFSFDLVSYGAGLLGLSLPLYAGATLFGMIPSTLLLTFMGDRIQLNPLVIFELALAFTVLFVAVPVTMHRYNVLNLKTLMSWE